ncbi:MAG: translocation/assembly module TamB [Gemmatimonadota bacterium]|nr:translocation/assembly module TamB [Gemmatimonadota bacterium]
MTPGRRRGWPLALAKGAVVLASALVALGAGAAVVISHTTAGRDFALEWALERLRPSLVGTLRIGSVGPSGLLAGATLRDVELGDGRGRAVLVADSIRARYSIAELFGGPPAIADLRIWSPVVHLEPEPGEPVTLSGLLAGTETGEDPGERAADPPAYETGSPLFRIRGARIHGGTVIMRDASGAEERVEGIEADFARVDIGPSREVGLAAEMDEAALSYPVGAGARLELSGLRGEVEVGADGIVVRAERFRLPGSEGSGRMAVDLSDEPRSVVFDLDLSRLSLPDASWLDERLDRGVARGGVRVAIEGDDVHVDVRGAEVDANPGSFTLSGGVSFTDRVRFRGLRVGPRMLATAEIGRWLADTPPFAGAVSGDISFDGEPGRLRVSGDLALFDGTGLKTRARVTGGGTMLGVRSFEGMEVEIGELDYALLEFFAPGVAWGGRGDLVLRADGDLATGMTVRIAANHSFGAGPGNSITVAGTVYGDTAVSVVEVDAALNPLSLSTIRRRWPGFPLEGPVSGSVSVNGSLEQLGFAAELETPAGPLSAEGRINGRDLAAGYRVTVSARDFRLSELFGGLPDSTVVSGRAHLSGSGLDRESLRGALALSAGVSGVGRLRVDTAALVAWFEDDGLVHLGALYAQAGGVVVEGHGGTLGLASGATGSGVGLSMSSRSIRPLRPVFMRGDPVAWDELSLIERERLEFAGADPSTFPTLRETRFDGTVGGRIRLEGGLGDLRAEASVTLGDLEYGPSGARAVTADLAAAGLSLVRADAEAASPAPVLEWEINGDSVVVEGREFHSGRIGGRFQPGAGGALHALVERSESEHYEAQAELRLGSDGGRLNLDRLTFVFPDRRWNLQGPASFEWNAESVVVNDFGLIRPGSAGLRLFADGRIARLDGDSDFELRATGLDLGVAGRVLQLAEAPVGVMSADLSARGTAGDPEWTGSVRIGDAGYGSFRFDSVTADARYGAGELTGLLESWTRGRRSLRLEGTAPLDLRLAAVEDRVRDDSVQLEVVADSFPAATVLTVLTGLEEVTGTITGQVAISGLASGLEPDGILRLENAAGRADALGVRVSSVNVDMRLSPDGTLAVAGAGRSGDGDVRVSGTVGASGPGDDFDLDLAFWPRRFLVVDRPDMVVAVSGDSIVLAGSFHFPRVEGRLEVNDGTVFLDEFQRSAERIDFYDPALFSAATRIGPDEREESETALRARNPFLQNLGVFIDMRLGRGNWLRSREMNVETAGDLSVTFDRQKKELIVQGDIDVVRGTYSLGPRTFRMTDGSFRFVGTPGFNPGLSVTAENRMRTREGEPLVITADISGTLLSPHLSLTSDAEQAMSEADLVSYVLFGRPTSALIGEGGAGSVGAGRDLLVGQLVNQIGYLLAQELDIDHLSVSQADRSQANAAFGASSLQVELGWYVLESVFLTGVYQRGFCADPTLPVGNGGVRVEVEMPKDVTLEGFLEGRCTRRRYRGVGDLALELARIWGLQIFREWGY